MSTDSQTVAVSKPMLWGGRVLSTLVILALATSAVMKFAQPEGTAKGVEEIGWRLDQVTTLGTIELVCVILYAIPQTSILGAILLTGYLGGAVATHLRIDDNFVAPIIVGVMVWGGLWLRDARLRALTPWGK